MLLPRSAVPLLDPPALEDENDRNPGGIRCPSGQNLAQRGTPMPVTSAELIECPTLFDGEQVRYEGEAVGEVLLRPTHGWVHVNDDLYAIQIGPLSEHRTVAGGNSGMAVSMAREQAAAITPGSHHTAGTKVEIVGTYLRSDPRDDGAPAIRAISVDVTREARPVAPAQVSLRRAVVAAVLMAATVVLLIVLRVSRRRQA
jgi:hypothetical protein